MLPARVRGDAAVDLVAAVEQRLHRLRAESPASRPKRSWSVTEHARECLGEMRELRALRRRRQIAHHGVSGNEHLLERRRVSGMEMRADLGGPRPMDLSNDR